MKPKECKNKVIVSQPLKDDFPSCKVFMIFNQEKLMFTTFSLGFKKVNIV